MKRPHIFPNRSQGESDQNLTPKAVSHIKFPIRVRKSKTCVYIQDAAERTFASVAYSPIFRVHTIYIASRMNARETTWY